MDTKIFMPDGGGGVMKQTELEEILRKHRLWLHSDEGGQRAILKDMDLSGISLKGEDLREIDFSHSNLEAANFNRSDLRGAYFNGAILYRANFHQTNLRESHFIKANLELADLSNASANGANFGGANMKDSCLYGCDFRNAILRNVDFRGADLRETDFRGAVLLLSGWPLGMNMAGMETDIQFIYLLLAHVAALRCDDPEFEEIKAKIMPYALKSKEVSKLFLEW